ncbi:MAG: DUF6671 family protein [Geminicoccaceae bacterium]
MTRPQNPYAGAEIALGSMHDKQRAIAPPVARVLGARLVVPPGIDTDAFGTFTGEIARYGSMLEAARAKARLGMRLAGTALGIASEGAYGPHPYIPGIPGGTELVLLVDDERGLEIREAIVVRRTNYDSLVCGPGDPLEPFLSGIGFPAHAVVVQPHVPVESPDLVADALATLPPAQAALVAPGRPLFLKGIRDRDELAAKIATAAALSFDGRALLVTDMRAHLNPTRMVMIRRAAMRLVRRAASLCPDCGTPGFGMVDVARGLPCAACGLPTARLVAEIHRCAGCGCERRVRLRGEDERADPGQCEHCNP